MYRYSQALAKLQSRLTVIGETFKYSRVSGGIKDICGGQGIFDGVAPLSDNMGFSAQQDAAKM